MGFLIVGFKNSRRVTTYWVEVLPCWPAGGGRGPRRSLEGSWAEMLAGGELLPVGRGGWVSLHEDLQDLVAGKGRMEEDLLPISLATGCLSLISCYIFLPLPSLFFLYLFSLPNNTKNCGNHNQDRVNHKS
eukprot:TRINITY_DN4936_c0_g1_i7.p1 TRINITY_DN4936_c0_g1~~TRINITY_DN4936_c0_g1_i7.p1  ORF type:complete len:131 (-),score=17.17 TRINITY_DN4936_c0_g1_i7:119-511(-)